MVEEMISPWLTEPNREEFEHCGLKCLILRHDELGHFCGYVGLPESHPWFGVESNQCLLGCKSKDCTWEKHHPSPDNMIHVHGGLTFSEMGKGKYPEGYWWFGFDCAHYNDYVPKMVEVLTSIGSSYDMGGVYRNIEYVRSEIKRMAEQVSKYSKTGWFWSRYWRLYWHWLAFKEDYCWKGWRFRRDVKAWVAHIKVKFPQLKLAVKVIRDARAGIKTEAAKFWLRIKGL